MRKIVLALFLVPLIAIAQTYKYIGVEEGVGNRRIFSIQKDSKGYMWFLTNEGIDRYNGKDIKHYKLLDEENKLSSQIRLSWLYTTEDEGLWVAGKKGRIFQYETKHDRFKMMYQLPQTVESICYGYMDHHSNIWLCGKDSIALYNTRNNQVQLMPNPLKSNIMGIEQTDDTHFAIATENGIRYSELEDNNLQIIPCEALDSIHAQISKLYFHHDLKRLFVGTFTQGIFVYDVPTQRLIYPKADLSDVNITQIIPYNPSELLIATEGMGIYKMNVNTCVAGPFLVANYESNNEMKGNIINDVYVDEEKRIWMANYPSGITVVDYRYQNYKWIKHSIGNRQSLINDQVHCVIEDSDGDLWFGTSNGISLYHSQTGQWHSFLSSFDRQLQDRNHIYTTLCEVSPGVIWAGGYTSGIYKINKKALSVEYFSPFLLTSINMRPDKYIRDIQKDSEGNIWSGGYYNLKCFDLKHNDVRLYPGVNSITVIREKDSNHMWIGTSTGLYILDKDSGKYQYIDMPVKSTYINSLYQAPNGILYIGTNGSGVVIYNPDNNTFKVFHIGNCSLLSNNIFTILPEKNGYIIMSTENGLTYFSRKDRLFRNWTKEQGLVSTGFNPSSGTMLKGKGFIFGSTDGAIEFPMDIKLPNYVFSKIILSDFRLSYQPVYPGDEDSPLKEDIDRTEVLRLKHNQNSFSLRVSSINYDFPSNILYSWKLDGFYTTWSPPRADNLIRFTNLNPGKYKLHIRALSNEEQNVVFEERTIDIFIAQPIWFSYWAILCYAVLLVLISISIIRVLYLKKQKKISDEKTRFFVSTAHDLRTPLTLIKAPLEELHEKEKLSEEGSKCMKTALKNVDALLRLTSNLINFERADVYSSQLCIAEHDLDAYLKSIYNAFQAYVVVKNVNFTYENNFSNLKVWFDKEKMDSILKNILSNAIKYTPEHGSVNVSASETKNTWKIIINDTGIGIPSSEQSKLFKLHFRGSNAINSKITGSGIGLMLVWKLVHLHGGKISINSTEHHGTTVHITFKKDYKHLRGYILAASEKEIPKEIVPEPTAPILPGKDKTPVKTKDLPRILIAEDNDELRDYLSMSLSNLYDVQTCHNGKEALIITKEFWPHLILSDIIMPEMRGDEFCATIKSDIETSHIPVMLLTALANEKYILKGLETGADSYIVKPFSIKILKARIANLLANRKLLRSKYANPEVISENNLPAVKGTNSLDWEFMSDVKKSILKNLDNPDFNVDSLCSMHNMSRTSFYNKIKALTGEAPSDYIRIFRLTQAIQLLNENRYTIAEIAGMTGFCDSRYFREVFKKHFNVSPSKYGKEEATEKKALS